MRTPKKELTPYWNPVLETLPLEKLRELQVRKFRRIVEWAYKRSKFHRKLYQEAGLKPGDIRSYDDVVKVPKVEKSMMRDIQRKDPFPYGDALCVPLEEVTEFRQTSGTTGPRSISRTPGRTGSGGRNPGPTSFMPRATGTRTGSFFPSGTISLSPSGPAIMPLKRSVARLSRAESSTRRRASSRSRNCGPRP